MKLEVCRIEPDGLKNPYYQLVGTAFSPQLPVVLYIFCIVYLYSAQYLHVLKDSKCYLTHPTVQVQPNSKVTDIALTEGQRLKDDHLSTSLKFFTLPLGIGSNDRGLTILSGLLMVPGIKPTTAMFPGESVTHQTTVAYRVVI